MKQKLLSITLCAGFALSFGYSLADDAEQGSTGSSWDPNFYATFGLVSWTNYGDLSNAALEDLESQIGTPVGDLDAGGTTRLAAGVGMRPTERLSFEFMLGDLPKSDLTILGSAIDSDEDIKVESYGWNARLAAEYAFPLSSNGMKFTTRAGISHTEIKGSAVSLASAADTENSELYREKLRLQDPFVGFGMRIPLSGMVDGMEMSLEFTKIFAGEGEADQSFGAQLIYNFD